MFSRVACLTAAVWLVAAPLCAQTPAPDPAAALLGRLDTILNAHDRAAFPALFSGVPPAIVNGLTSDLFDDASVHTTVHERDRADLEGAPKGDGYRLVVEFFIDSGGHARIVTVTLGIRRPPGGDIDSWRIVRSEGSTSVGGLYRLRLDTSKQFAATNFVVSSEDFTLTLQDGAVFEVQCDDGITGFVLAGRGQMRFAPKPETEQGQLEIFSGSDTLVTPFETAFVRVNPSDYEKVATMAALRPAMPDPRVARRAQETFDRESVKSYVVDLQDLSPDRWHLLPPAQDFIAEVPTRKYDTLTYLRSTAQAEDVMLFQRARRKTIALYASTAKIAARGRFYSDDLLRDYDVLDYNIDAAVDPKRQFVDGHARLLLRARATLSNITLRLADPLSVTSVSSVEFGRLLHLHITGQNMILVNLPHPIEQDDDVTLLIEYAGRLPSQQTNADSLQVSPEPQELDQPLITPEPSFLLSNQVYWYPQNPVPDYATATLRITVPDGYTAIGSGRPVDAGAAVTLRDLITTPSGAAFSFRADQPLRYLSVIVSRFTRVADDTLTLDGDGGQGERVDIAVDATPRARGHARATLTSAEDILRFYARLMGDAPFPTITVALTESDLPGGHAPGYVAIVNDPIASFNLSWRNDPAAFDGFPEFFLAHELAHQWWGQAVGWKNYHEQWLSEGFAQYFAALYAQQVRGDRVFGDMLRQFRKWSLAESDQGPVRLGNRLGHLKSDPRVFRALVYNKGAAVLHMLRRLVGDDVFFRALRRLYTDRKFQKAGTDDVERAFEAESGRSLTRFFEQWIDGTGIPQVTYHTTIAGRSATVRFEQTGDTVFDIPVTVTLTYADGRTEDTVVAIGDKVTEKTIAGAAAIRQVQVNRDSAALAEFDEE
ncbi:MAG TPA: M1 family aminopeptidase [Vicinamibacterales bacterium]|nr:M1 family aminopeptidase [Vicinamibacterales bacterium]